MTDARRVMLFSLAWILCQEIDAATQSGGATPPDAIEVLRAGVPSHGRLDEQGAARFHIAMTEGEAFEVTVAQPDADLRLRLSDASGEEIARVNLRRPQQGDERALGSATTSGPVLLSIERAGGMATVPARFSVTLSLHPATDRARRWSDAARAYTRGEAQTATGTGDGFRASP